MEAQGKLALCDNANWLAGHKADSAVGLTPLITGFGVNNTVGASDEG